MKRSEYMEKLEKLQDRRKIDIELEKVSITDLHTILDEISDNGRKTIPDENIGLYGAVHAELIKRIDYLASISPCIESME